MFVRRWFLSAVLVALVAVPGCSKGGLSGNLATVSGAVTYNGAPLDGAKVTFHSTIEEGGKRAQSYGAQTDSSGKYLIAAVGKDQYGIPPGMYKVTVTKLDPTGKGVPADFDEGQMAASGMSRNLMPKDYENPNTTKLSVTLEPGKNEGKNFDLKGSASSSSKPTQAMPIP